MERVSSQRPETAISDRRTIGITRDAKSRRIEEPRPAGARKRITNQINPVITITTQTPVVAGGDIDQSSSVESKNRIELPALDETLWQSRQQNRNVPECPGMS